jgi:hypothetical protein
MWTYSAFSLIYITLSLILLQNGIFLHQESQMSKKKTKQYVTNYVLISLHKWCH